jgi:diguanylate cyclase (GGDEF)-like protein/PAS domain S-box-containing protein
MASARMLSAWTVDTRINHEAWSKTSLSLGSRDAGSGGRHAACLYRLRAGTAAAMKTTEVLQHRVRTMMWVSVLTVMFSVLLDSYWLAETVEAVGSQAQQQSINLLQLEESMGVARAELLEQVREWKDGLLRARNPGLLAAHQAAFNARDANVRKALNQVKVLMQAVQMDASPVDAIFLQHAQLSANYRLALRKLDPRNPLSFEAVDQQVRGQDRQVLDNMALMVQRFDTLILDRASGRGFVKDDDLLKGRSVALGALGLFLPLTALLAFFISYRAMRQLGRDARRERAIFEAIGDGVVVVDAQGRIKTLNPKAEQLVGCSEAKVKGLELTEVFQLIEEQSRRTLASPMAELLRVPQAFDMTQGIQLRREDGSHISIECSVNPLIDAHGQLFGMVMVFRDVSQQRTTARRLQEREEQLRLTLKYAADAVFITKQDGRILYVNDTVINLLGYGSDELTRMTAFDLVPANWRERYISGSASIFSKPTRQVFEVRLTRKDGVRIPMELNAVLLPDGNVYGSCRDITDRRRAELALKEQVKYFKALNQFADAIAENEGCSTLLHSAVRIIGETLSLDRALIYNISFVQRQVAGLCEWLNPRHPDILPTLATYPLDFFIGGATQLLTTRHYQTSQADAINPCLLQDGSGALLHQQMHIQSALWYPFDFCDQDSYQVLTLNQVNSKRNWTPPELDFIAAVCQQLSIALNKLKMLEVQRQADENLRIAAKAFDSQHGAFVTDAQRTILRVNQAFTQITGYSEDEALGQNSRMRASGRHDQLYFANMWSSIEETGAWQGEIWNRRKNGEIYPEWLSISSVTDDAGQPTHYVATFFDLTERKSAEERIHQLAFSDPLTGLPNRALFLGRLEHAQVNTTRNKLHGALLLIDLDHFKVINETHGHGEGDQLLAQVAKRLTACVNEGDTVARLAGDKFALLLENLKADEFEAAEQVDCVGQRLLASLSAPYLLGCTTHHSSASIGVTLFGNSLHESTDDPLKRAELAMYQAKSAGRNTLQFFETQMQLAVTYRAALETDLREAVFNKQFLLHYQAQVQTGGHITGAEVLVRWQHPQRGLVSPAEFIPLAEETALILPLGKWVLETACTQLAVWAKLPAMERLTLAVNVSARQFGQANFVDEVASVLERSGANPKRLKLELTESMLVSDVENIITKMTQLRAKGVGFSLDDFGTGYSSLAYLKRLPLDQLKIDQSFLRNILTDANDAAIAKMVISLADSMGLGVIAEGVEFQAQADFLAAHACHAYQGYLFSRPVPVKDFEMLVSRQMDQAAV